MGNANSISIMGEGTISGGEYDKISVNGEGITIGKITCNTLKVNGECTINEELTGETIKIRGEVISNKAIRAEKLKMVGEITCGDECCFNEVDIVGEANFKENLTFKKFKNLGELSVYKDCEGQEFESVGEIDIKGLLSADNIDIKVKGKSFINEIGGSKIKILDKHNMFSKKGVMKCYLIEGDEVELENTDANIVRGINVRILKGCTINKVEYTGEIEVDKDSVVKELVCQKN